MGAKLLDRIRKLLALSQSSNPAEAASALAHAQRLMAEHSLSQQDLDVAEIEIHSCDDDKMSRAPRAPSYENMLAQVLCDAFGVLAVRKNETRARICFYGPGARAEIAAYCFVVLLRQLVRARLEYMANGFAFGRTASLVNAGNAFAEGWVEAVSLVVARVFMTEREERAVAIWQEQNLGRTVDTRGRAACWRGTEDAVAEGRRQGSQVDLYRSMGAGGAPRQLTERRR